MAGPVVVVLGGKCVAAGKQKEFVFEDRCSLSLPLRHTHTHTHTHTQKEIYREEHKDTSIPQRETLPPGHPPEGINTNTQVWNNEGGDSFGD